MNLREKMLQALAAAKSAVEAGDLEKAETHRLEAEGYQKQIKALKALSEIESDTPVLDPIRPELPGSTEKSSAVPSAVPDATPDAPKGEAIRQAAYQTRFNGADASAKAILTDLHGQNHEQAYWSQRGAFRKYLRHGAEALKSDERSMLSQVVMTPSVVKMALREGIDDLSSIRATMIEAADTLGGFMVPVDFQMRILERLPDLTVVRGRASQMNTSRDRVEMPEATGASGRYANPVRVTWVDETPALGTGDTSLTFGLRGIPVHTVMAETALSRNLLEDTAFNIESYLETKLSEAAAIDEDKQFMVGTGVGKPQGILPNRANSLSLTEVNSGSSSALTWNKLIAMTYAIPAQYRNQNAAWYANKNTYLAIAQMQDSTSGNYLWDPYQFGGGTDGRQRTLLGYPIVESEELPDVASAAYPLFFGDMKAYTIVDRIGMTVERFLDSQTARQNLVYFVMRRRLGGQLLESWKLAVQKVAS